MTVRYTHAEAAILPNSTERASRSLLRAILTDVHFWIPLTVLLGGLLLLDKLH
jgi:hypothetical protein